MAKFNVFSPAITDMLDQVHPYDVEGFLYSLLLDATDSEFTAEAYGDAVTMIKNGEEELDGEMVVCFSSLDDEEDAMCMLYLLYLDWWFSNSRHQNRQEERNVGIDSR